jgi:hypothetical protein
MCEPTSGSNLLIPMMSLMGKMKMEPVRSHKTQRPLALGVLDMIVNDLGWRDVFFEGAISIRLQPG